MSQKQIEANRRNAQLSTGPVSSAGKQRVRYNALRHGIYARDVVLPAEDFSAYSEMLDQLHDDLSPVGPIECSLVGRLADLWWRMGRTSAIETSLLTPDPERGNTLNDQVMQLRIERQRALNYMGEGTPQPDEKLAADYIRFDAETTPKLDQLSRYEGRLEKSFERSMVMLDRLQAARQRRREIQESKTMAIENKQ